MGAKLDDVGFIKELSKDARATLWRETRLQHARKDQTLVRQGDTLSSVFLLLDGVLRVYTITAEGKEATLYQLREGEVCLLSLNAAFSKGRYPAWVSVESPTARLALLPGQRIRSLFSQEAVIQDIVLKSLTSTIRNLLTHLDEALTRRLSERIECFLLRNCDASGRINITHQSLANHLGVMREAVSREILVLKRQKKIVSGRGFLQISAK